MSQDDLFADERLQFYLRNRDDIRTWAAIESDVFAATREVLARAQHGVEERLLAGDPGTIVGRLDGGSWERIIARHEHWPNAVGLTLEWNRSVDPQGANRPKIGVFWSADPKSLEAPRARLAEVVDQKALLAMGYKIPLGGVWPVGLYAPAPAEWWRDADAWIESLVERMAKTWPMVNTAIDDVLRGVNWQVGDG